MTSGRITTHVLDTATGRPARGLWIELFRLEGDTRHKLAGAATNADGRLDGPLVEGADLAAGTYEIVFHAGDYLRGEGMAPPQPPFLNLVPVRFGIADPTQHYHVPLLVSPFGYTTYRGS